MLLSKRLRMLCVSICLQINPPVGIHDESSLQKIIILTVGYLTLDYEGNKYRPDIGSRRCGGPSCCLMSNPVDVACSLVQGEDVHRSPSLGSMLFSTEFVA